MRIDDSVPRIPAAALAVEDAELLHRFLAAGEKVRVHLVLGARDGGEVDSWNVVGELPGRELRDEVVLIGAHLDAWDLGTGALDDGAGCGIVLDTARSLLRLGLRPRRTVRVVLFMNEELGLSGARAYAAAHKDELPRHVAALEADSGAGLPRGYTVAGGEASRALVRKWAAPLERLAPLQIASVPEVGADLLPLQAAGVPVLGVEQDVSDYFDWHHSAGDSIDKINPHHLALAAAAFASLTYQVAESPLRLPPSPPPPPR
jgi:Zn-dependent M28 family amino/carboxypeptidase